jgi:hypothetical protein
MEHLQLMRDALRLQENETDVDVSTASLSDEARERIRRSLTNKS